MNPMEYKLTRIIQKIPLFAGLTSPQMINLLQKTRATSFGPNICIYKRGDVGTDMLILLEGKLAVTDETGALLAHIHPGEPAGELSVFTHEKRLANVTTVERSKVLTITRAAIDTLLRTDADMHLTVLDNLVDLLTARLRNANRRIGEQDRELRRYRESPEAAPERAGQPEAVTA